MKRSLLHINVLVLAILHLPRRAHRLLLLNFGVVLLLDLHALAVVGVHALPAHVEVALPAVVELVGVLAAEVALSLALEGGQFQLVLVVAGIEEDGPALETVAYALLLTVVASQLYYLLFLALPALGVPVLRTSQVHQHMVFLALRDYRSLFVCSHASTVLQALSAEPCLTNPVVAILLLAGSTPHAPKFLLLLRELDISQPKGLNLMIVPASPIEVDVHQLAAEAVVFLAVIADLGALLVFGAQGADIAVMHDIHIDKFFPARAERVNIGYKFPGFRLIEPFRQFAETPLADAKIAQRIVIDSVVADRGTDAANIAYEIDVGDAFEGEGVADGAALLGTGGYPADHAVELVADPAEGAREALVFAGHAY